MSSDPLKNLGTDTPSVTDGRAPVDDKNADKAGKKGQKPDPKAAAPKPGIDVPVPKSDGNKMFIMAGAMAGVIAIVLGGIALLGGRSDPSIERAQIRSSAQLGFTTEEEIRVFLKNYGLKIDKNEADVAAIQKEIAAIKRDIDQAKQDLTKSVQNALDGFKAAGEQQLARLDDAIRNAKITATAAQPSAADDEKSRILKELRNAWVNPSASMTPTEARKRAVELLKQSGIKDEKLINDMVAKAAEDAGIMLPSDIAEPPASQAELDKVPTHLRPHISDTKTFLEGKALYDGIVDHGSAKAAMRRFLELKTGKDKAISAEDIDAMYPVVRVRRENVTDAMLKEVPALIKMRESVGIARTSQNEIAKMINNQKTKLRIMPTPGQFLSLVELVSRSIGAGDKQMGDKGALPSIDPERMAIMRKVTEQALENAWNTGRRDEVALGQVAFKVVDNYLEVARISMTDPQKIDWVGETIAAFVLAKTTTSGPSAGPRLPVERQPVTTRPPVMNPGATAVPAPTGPTISVGGVSVGREGLRKTLYLMTRDVLTAANLDPATDAGVCAAIVYWEQLNRLTDAGMETLAGSTNGIPAIAQGLMPRAIELAKAGSTIADVKVGLPSQQDTPQKRRALLTWLAKRIGPVVHDATKAADEVIAADTALRSPNPPDLTQVAKAMGGSN